MYLWNSPNFLSNSVERRLTEIGFSMTSNDRKKTAIRQWMKDNNVPYSVARHAVGDINPDIDWTGMFSFMGDKAPYFNMELVLPLPDEKSDEQRLVHIASLGYPRRSGGEYENFRNMSDLIGKALNAKHAVISPVGEMEWVDDEESGESGWQEQRGTIGKDGFRIFWTYEDAILDGNTGLWMQELLVRSRIMPIIGQYGNFSFHTVNRSISNITGQHTWTLKMTVMDETEPLALTNNAKDVAKEIGFELFSVDPSYEIYRDRPLITVYFGGETDGALGGKVNPIPLSKNSTNEKIERGFRIFSSHSAENLAAVNSMPEFGLVKKDFVYGKKRDANSEPSLHWNIGVNHESQPVIKSLRYDCFNISGMHYSGKSNILYSMLFQIAYKNTSDQVRFWIADPLRRWENISSLDVVDKFTGVDKSDEAKLAMTLEAVKESRRRAQFIVKEGEAAGTYWETWRHHKLPFIVLVLGDVDNLFRTSSEFREAMRALTKHGNNNGISVVTTVTDRLSVPPEIDDMSSVTLVYRDKKAAEWWLSDAIEDTEAKPGVLLVGNSIGPKPIAVRTHKTVGDEEGSTFDEFAHNYLFGRFRKTSEKD